MVGGGHRLYRPCAQVGETRSNAAPDRRGAERAGGVQYFDQKPARSILLMFTRRMGALCVLWAGGQAGERVNGRPGDRATGQAGMRAGRRYPGGGADERALG